MNRRVNKIISLFLVLICLISLTSCGKQDRLYSKDAFLMGTIINLKYYGKNGEKALEESIKIIENIENSMSLTLKDSDINKINKEAQNSPIELNDDMYNVIERALYYSKLSDGSLDISVRPVDKLWAIGTENERVPDKSEIKNNLKYVGYENIELHKENKSISFKKDNMEIDLGAIAKGYTADKLVDILKKYKVERALINLGGNLYIYGGKENGDSLNIGIQDPKKDKGEYFATLRIKDKSVVTSGNYERYFEKDGKRYHHIIDPKTGYPAENGLISTTIISDKSMDGDALSTATYVLGLEKSIKLINSLENVDAVFVTSDKKVYTTKGLNKENFNLSNKEYIYEEGR